MFSRLIRLIRFSHFILNVDPPVTINILYLLRSDLVNNKLFNRHLVFARPFLFCKFNTFVNLHNFLLYLYIVTGFMVTACKVLHISFYHLLKVLCLHLMVRFYMRIHLQFLNALLLLFEPPPVNYPETFRQQLLL